MDCEASVWIDNFNKVGLPLALLGLAIYAMASFVKWAFPRVDSYMAQYFTIAERKAKTLEDSAAACTALQRENLDAIKALTEAVKALEEKIK